MNEVTDNTKVNALMLEELEHLSTENAELKVQLSEKACVMCNYLERSDCKNEKAALKAMVNGFRSSVLDALNMLAKVDKDRLSKSRAVGILNEVLFKSEEQSLHDNDMALAEKVLDAVYRTGLCSPDIYDDDNLDITSIVRGENIEIDE